MEVDNRIEADQFVLGMYLIVDSFTGRHKTHVTSVPTASVMALAS